VTNYASKCLACGKRRLSFRRLVLNCNSLRLRPKALSARPLRLLRLGFPVAARASGHLRSAQCAIDANSGAIDEIIRQQADLRSRLVALEGQIAAEAAVVLVAEVDGKLAEVKAAADSLNLKIAAVISRAEILAAEAEWEGKFMGLIE